MILKAAGAVALAVATIGAATTQTADGSTAGHHEHTVVAPKWMTNVCKTEDSVNCWWDGGSRHSWAGEAFIRQMPGRTHMVCVLFVHRPRKDYCS